LVSSFAFLAPIIRRTATPEDGMRTCDSLTCVFGWPLRVGWSFTLKPSSVSLLETHVAQLYEAAFADQSVVEKPCASTDTEISNAANKKKTKTRAKMKTTAKKAGTATRAA
jgi:hypothetical protein